MCGLKVGMKTKMNSLLKLFRNIQNSFVDASNNILKSQTLILNTRPILMEYDGDDWKNYLPSLKKLNEKMIETKLTYGRFILTEFSNDEFELLLIVWPPNSITPIHDHPMNGCCLRMLEGEITESMYYNHTLEKSSEKIIKPPQVGYIDNKWAYHKIENKSNKMAYSLHLYSPPNFKSKTFTEKNLK